MRPLERNRLHSQSKKARDCAAGFLEFHPRQAVPRAGYYLPTEGTKDRKRRRPEVGGKEVGCGFLFEKSSLIGPLKKQFYSGRSGGYPSQEVREKPSIRYS